MGGLQHQRRPQLAADGPLTLQPCGRAHLAHLAHHRRSAVAGRRCGHCAADQPPAQAAVVRRQPRQRRRLRRQPPGRRGGDQRNPRGEHRLQPHGPKAGQAGTRPRGDAGRHFARPAHAPGAPAARDRNERDGRHRPRTHGGRHRSARRHHRQVPGLRPPRPCHAHAGEPARRGVVLRVRRARPPGAANHHAHPRRPERAGR